MKKIALVLMAMCCGPLATAGEEAGHRHGGGHEKERQSGTDQEKERQLGTESMRPAPELEQLAKNMEGTWSCEGKAADHGKKTMHRIKSTMTAKQDLDGHWIRVDYEEEKTRENPRPYAFEEAIGFDGKDQKFQRLYIDNMGGAATMDAKLVEKGDRMEWTGDARMNGDRTPMRHIVTEKSDKERTIEVAMKNGRNGQWQTVARMTCNKE